MHKELALASDHKPKEIFIITDGDILEITENSVQKNGRVQAGKIIVEGDKTEDYGSVVLRDRKQLSNTGIVVCTLIAHSQTGELISEPEVYFKGFFLKNNTEKIIAESKKIIEDTFFNATMDTKRSRLEIQEEIRTNLRRYCKKKFDKKPLVIPIVLEV
jgi:ribonuclease J